MLARVWAGGSLVVALLITGCSDNAGPDSSRFLSGTVTDPSIALMVSSSRNSLMMLQIGAPSVREEIPLGASSAVTPGSFAVRGSEAVIPLGNAASVALVDLTNARVERFFTFPSGNATGSAWLNDDVAITCNQNGDYCGRFSVSQVSTAITDTVHVTAFPTGVIVVGSRIFIISSNLDDNFLPIADGVITEVDPTTFAIVRTFTVGRDPQYAAVGPDGNLYVTNSGDYGSNNGSLSIIDLTANTVETLPGFGDFPGAIAIDDQGRAFISSFSIGTLAWNTVTRTFIRGPADPICAPISGGGCRAASSASVAPNGDLYQAFFGSASSSQPAYLFIYNGTTLALQDSIPVPLGPDGMTLHSFR